MHLLFPLFLVIVTFSWHFFARVWVSRFSEAEIAATEAGHLVRSLEAQVRHVTTHVLWGSIWLQGR